jgi:hypothetical protein
MSHPDETVTIIREYLAQPVPEAAVSASGG